MKKFIALSVVAVAGLTASAMADVSYSGSVALTNTNWSDSISVPRFNPALLGPDEEMYCVVIKLTGSVEGRVRAESLDGAPSLINATISATLTANAPAGLQVITVPLTNTMFNASPFDGVIDFGGTSGFDTGTVAGGDMDSNSVELPADLSPYIGVGNILIGVTAAGTSNVSGAGNIVSIINTAAGVDLEITYKTRLIPTPGAAALVGIGGLMVARRRRA